jgi:large subunit ribosomal protein L20
MARTKGGVVTRRRHKKILELTRGQWGSKSRLFRRAQEAMMKSLWYSYGGRKQRARQLRELWITRINAGARMHNLSYSKFIHALKLAGIELDRKILSDIAVRDFPTFSAIVQQAKAAIG